MRALPVVVLVACAKPAPAPTWLAEGSGDCAGGDVEMTVGSDVPDPLFCGGDTAGLVAICWDQAQFTNPAQSGPWCTYKDTPALECGGGPTPGLFFVCEP